MMNLRDVQRRLLADAGCVVGETVSATEQQPQRRQAMEITARKQRFGLGNIKHAALGLGMASILTVGVAA